MPLAAAGNKTLALERKKKLCVLKKTDLRFICFLRTRRLLTLQLEVGDHINQQKAV